MDTITMRTVGDGVAWLADLVPFLVTPLVLLLLWEVALLLATILATTTDTPRHDRHGDAARPATDVTAAPPDGGQELTIPQ